MPEEFDPQLPTNTVGEELQYETSFQRWLQNTVQRLSEHFKTQTDVEEKRSLLRRWQRIYHPDKNQGRAHEVLPIFRWVQTCWEREFRSASVVASMPAAPDVRVQSADAQERPGMRAGARSVNVAPAKRHEGKRLPEKATNDAKRKQPTKRSAKLC